MSGVGGLSGWRWLFVFDGIITLPMALWGKSNDFYQYYHKTSSSPDDCNETRLLCIAGSAQQHPRPLAEGRRKGDGFGQDEACRKTARRTGYNARLEARAIEVAFLGLHQLLYVSNAF